MERKNNPSAGKLNLATYLVAIIATLAALAIRLISAPWFGDRPVLILYLIPITLAAYFGGMGPGIVATAIAGLATNYYLIPPIGSLSIHRPVDFVQWLMLLAVGFMVSYLSERLHKFRKRAELLSQQAQHEEARFRQLCEKLPQLVWTTTADGMCDYLSPQWIAYTGIPEKEQLGRGWLEQVHPDDRPRIFERWQDTLDHDTPFQVEYRIRRHDGIYRWFDTRAVPLRDFNGRLIKWFGTNTDIDDRKQTEVRIRESEERFRTVVEVGPDAIFIQTNGNFAYVNPTAINLFGAKNAKQLIGTPVLDRFHPDYRAGVISRIRQLNEKHESAPLLVERILRCDGTEVDAEVSAVPFVYEGNHGALVFARDITQRKIAEQQLLLQGRALEASAAALVITDRYGKIMWVNPAFTLMSGYTEKEIVGRDIRIARSPAHDDAFYAKIWETILSGRVWKGELISKRKNGTLYTEEMTITPVVIPSSGEITHFIAVRQDITDRKQAEAERKKLEEQLSQSQKMDALGRLSGGIAHDFNNILAALGGHVRLALEDIPQHLPVRQHVVEIERAMRRARDLVRRILAFSRNEKSNIEPMELEIVVSEAIDLLRAMVPAMVQIDKKFVSNLPMVNADATQIHQIIMNLGSNAAHAMKENGGMLEFAMDEVHITAEQARLSPELYEGNFIRLAVSDQGCGMSKNTSERIFEPFFTTKEVGEGTGLGLSVVHGIMKSHKGAITVYSQPGKGTIFHLYFPVTHDRARKRRRTIATSPRGNGERILFVDDEKMLATVSSQILQRLGYTVSCFTRPNEALAAFQAAPASFDAIITDYSMPGMTGVEFVRKTRELRADCPVILASGYIRPQDKDAAQELGIQHFISKPNTIDELELVLSDIFPKNKPPTQ